MHISFSLAGPDGCFFTMTDGTIHKGFIVYSMEDAYRIMKEYILEEDERVHTIIEDFVHNGLPRTSTQSPLILQGSCVVTLGEMARYMATLANGHWVGFTPSHSGPLIYSFFLPTDSSYDDALMGYRDAHGREHIVIFYSKAQGKKLLAANRVGNESGLKSRLKRLRECSLPEQSDRPVIDITGNIAGWLNQAYMRKKIFLATSS